MAFYCLFSLENREGAQPPVLNAMRTTSNAKIRASGNFNQIFSIEEGIESFENASRQQVTKIIRTCNVNNYCS